jgi:hypothetical protein
MKLRIEIHRPKIISIYRILKIMYHIQQVQFLDFFVFKSVKMKHRVPQTSSETLRLILRILKHTEMVRFFPVHAIKAEADTQIHSLLTSFVDGWECLNSCSGRFTPEDIIDDIH